MKTTAVFILLCAAAWGAWHLWASDSQLAQIGVLPTPSATGIDEREAFVRAPTDAGAGEGVPAVLRTDVPTPDSVQRAVPHIVQAPGGNWKDVRQLNGSQEAAMLMAIRWVYGRQLSADEAMGELSQLWAYEEKTFSGAKDIGIQDMPRIFTEHFTYDKTAVAPIADMEDIRKILAAGAVIIAPVDATILNNPYYLATIPKNHTVVVVGYDNAKQQVIVNDPGTKRGAEYRYGYDIFLRALRPYPTGNGGDPSADMQKSVLLVHPRTQ